MMTPEQFELMRIAARSVLAERDAGRSVDPLRLEWAETLLRQNPNPIVNEPEKDEACKPG